MLKAGDILASVFPPPKRKLTLAQALPLLIFLAVFAGVCLFLQWRSMLLLAKPQRLWLILLIAPWFCWMHVGGYAGLPRIRGQIALASRLLIAGLLIVLLADPRAVRKHEQLSVVFAVDLSSSIANKAADAALTFTNAAAHEKPEKDEAGLVVFANDAAVELPPSVSYPFEAVNQRLDRDGTNLEKGLALAAAVLPEDSQGRIVLVTDGVQTQGDLGGVLDQLKSRGIAVDVLPVSYDYGREVWIERLELPRVVKKGETYEAAAIVSALTAGSGQLLLLENGQPIYQEQVEYKAGKNRLVVPIRLRDPGYYEYTAKLVVPPDQDGWARNNQAISYLYLQGEGKVLLVTDPSGDPRDFEDLVVAMKNAGRAVVEISAYEVPSDPLSLLPYDCIVFVNVPADSFVANQMAAVRDAVHNQGSGFLMVGGENSYGPGGYHHTAIEDTLPVEMDVTQKKVLPKGALVVCLHTCEFPDGNTWGKEITKRAIKVLGKQDDVGVLAYNWGQMNSGESWLFELTPAAEFDRLAKIINNAQIGDMPSFHNMMEMGLEALTKSDAAAKHMIIISDGDPGGPTPELVKKFNAAKISVSTVAVFPHGGLAPTLSDIAKATGGRFYYPQDPNLLPGIFIKEAKTLKRSMIQNKLFQPRVEFPAPLLKGLPPLPQLRGYVLVTAKASSQTILRGPETDQLDPVLSLWHYGVGKAAAFTSDLSPNWAQDWMASPVYQPFVKQLLVEISRVTQQSNLRLQTYTAGNSGVISVEDYAPTETFLDLQAQVNGPRDLEMTVPLKQVGPRRYEGRFPLSGEGRYQVGVVGQGDGRAERSHGGFAVAYSQEYLRFRADPIVLKQIAQRTGGRVLEGRESGAEIFDVPREARMTSRPIADWLLVLLACLIPLDVGIRRVQLDWQVIARWIGLGARQAPSEQTMAALRQRKQEVGAALQPGQGLPPPRPRTASKAPVLDLPLPSQSSDKSAAPGAVPPVASKPAAPTAAGGDSSTTERLLALKKKRRPDEPDKH